MTPRPLHKWKTFWLGLIILTFLLWAWARGRNHEDHVGAHIGTNTCYYIHNTDGYIAWFTQTADHSATPIYRFDYESRPTRPVAPWLPPPFTSHRYALGDLTGSDHGIAHWLITLLFLITWTTLLLWRRKKIVRLTEATRAKPFS